MDNNNTNDNNKEEIKEDSSVNRDSIDTSKDQIKELYRRIEELKKSNKQLEAYKQETEAKRKLKYFTNSIYSQKKNKTILIPC